MPARKGIIALMGSGELTATMVEVHKELLARYGGKAQAVFLDTPAGFQLNADQISQRAVDYFGKHIQQPMALASFKSMQVETSYEVQQTFDLLRQADFILIGPGSPTYALRQWRKTPIGEILIKQIEDGGCLVVASAAALTVGRCTLPVYEIYKVGDNLHWLDGLNILDHFGFNLAVIPHWNNAEGGTHDTRFCFMGEARFSKLEALLPDDVSVLGLDEHTACVIDLDREEAVIKGIGRVVLRRRGAELVFQKGDHIPLDVLRGDETGVEWEPTSVESPHADSPSDIKEGLFWARIHATAEAFRIGLEKNDPKETTNALLELDRVIWQAMHDLENEEFITQGREVLRDLIVLFGIRMQFSPANKVACLTPLVENLLELRDKFRRGEQWREADAIRDCLQRADIMVEDTKDGLRWGLKP